MFASIESRDWGRKIGVAKKVHIFIAMFELATR
jgi:hypothetical protein